MGRSNLRLAFRQSGHAHAKGRNGWFRPRLLEAELSRADDGTPLLTMRLYSRRRGEEAPIEITMALTDWQYHALTVQLHVNEQLQREGWALTNAS